MGLLKSRERFSNKGLGNLEVREVSPTNDAAYQNLGNLAESQIQDIEEIDEIKDENGSMQNALPSSLASRQMSKLQQVSIDEIAYIQGAAGKYHSIRYSGLANNNMFQYFCFPYGRIIRKIDRQFIKGQQTIPFEFLGLKQEATYDIPEFYIAEAKGRIRPENLQVWINSRSINALNYLTDRLLDISGFERHGQLNSDFAAIWQAGTTPERFLRFDGINDESNFGNILNDDASGDFVVETWVRIQATDGVQAIITGKKAAPGTTAGWEMLRTTGNKISFLLSSAIAESPVTSAASVLQNVWKHVLIAIDRDGVMRLYLNGVLDGTSASIAGTGSGTNTSNLYLGRDNNYYGKVDIGGYRVYRFISGGLPSDIATIAATHFNAERNYYGI